MNQVPTSAQILTTLLASGSFVLAVVGLAVSLSTPVKGGSRRIIGSPGLLAWLASGLLALTAVGAGFAWFDVYVSNWCSLSFPQLVMAVILIIVITVQPVFAVIIASGTRYEE